MSTIIHNCISRSNLVGQVSYRVEPSTGKTIFSWPSGQRSIINTAIANRLCSATFRNWTTFREQLEDAQRSGRDIMNAKHRLFQ